MELPRDWKLLTEREILGKLYERVVELESSLREINDTLEELQSHITDVAHTTDDLAYDIYKIQQGEE